MTFKRLLGALALLLTPAMARVSKGQGRGQQQGEGAKQAFECHG